MRSRRPFPRLQEAVASIRRPAGDRFDPPQRLFLVGGIERGDLRGDEAPDRV